MDNVLIHDDPSPQKNTDDTLSEFERDTDDNEDYNIVLSTEEIALIDDDIDSF